MSISAFIYLRSPVRIRLTRSPSETPLGCRPMSRGGPAALRQPPAWVRRRNSGAADIGTNPLPRRPAKRPTIHDSGHGAERRACERSTACRRRTLVRARSGMSRVAIQLPGPCRTSHRGIVTAVDAIDRWGRPLPTKVTPRVAMVPSCLSGTTCVSAPDVVACWSGTIDPRSVRPVRPR